MKGRIAITFSPWLKQTNLDIKNENFIWTVHLHFNCACCTIRWCARKWKCKCKFLQMNSKYDLEYVRQRQICVSNEHFLSSVLISIKSGKCCTVLLPLCWGENHDVLNDYHPVNLSYCCTQLKCRHLVWFDLIKSSLTFSLSLHINLSI